MGRAARSARRRERASFHVSLIAPPSCSRYLSTNPSANAPNQSKGLDHDKPAVEAARRLGGSAAFMAAASAVFSAATQRLWRAIMGENGGDPG